jgi:superfamily I DNA/RNA helicase
VVFVVNLNRGTGGIRPPIRVAFDRRAEAAVSIADYQSDADEDQTARDREETKRLLYVALTRARDRLYLSANLKEGALRMGRGSLGEVLPASLKSLFVEAMTIGAERRAVQWAGSRATHHFAARA